MRAARYAVFIQRAVRIRQGNPSIQWYKCPVKRSVFTKQVFIDFDGVKCGIPQEIFWFYKRMRLKEILQYGDQRFCVCEAFIFIWGIGFLFNGDIRMGFQKIFIIEPGLFMMP